MKVMYIIFAVILLIMMVIINMLIDLLKEKKRHHEIVPVNVKTRGIENYSQIGVLVANGKVLPLMGRRLYRGSQRWNYYVIANDHMALKIPMKFKGKECLGVNGCDEIYDGDTIDLYGYGTFKVRIYNKVLRYIPFI